MKHKDIDFIVEVESNEVGIIENQTEIVIISNDPYLTVISSKVLKRDLFREDYDFQKLGIGGMKKELFDLFRRALTTRAHRRRRLI